MFSLKTFIEMLRFSFFTLLRRSNQQAALVGPGAARGDYLLLVERISIRISKSGPIAGSITEGVSIIGVGIVASPTGSTWATTASATLLATTASTLAAAATLVQLRPIPRFSLHVLLHHVDHLVRNAQILDRTATDVTFGHSPKFIAILCRGVRREEKNQNYELIYVLECSLLYGARSVYGNGENIHFKPARATCDCSHL